MSRYIITGNLSSPQNVACILPWLRHYGPALFSADSDAQLTLAGKYPDSTLVEAASALGANVIASPPDMKPLLSEADIYICPSDNGSGIKLRVMDGLGAGLPVIAHKSALRGYEAFDGAGIFTYHDIDSFIEAISKCRDWDYDREDLRKRYLEVFSFPSGVERLRSILETI